MYFQCFYFLKVENKKSNQTCFQNSNILKFQKIKTENENSNQTHNELRVCLDETI